MDAKNGAQEQQMASKDKQKGTQKGAHEPAKTPAGGQKTYKEAKEVNAGPHGDAKWSCRCRLATNNKRTWVQHGFKKVPTQGPNERP